MAAAEPTEVAASGPAASAVDHAYTLRLPLARYSYTESEYATIQSAEHVLAKRCMESYSLSYQLPAPPPAATSVDRRYGLTEEASARRFGYRVPPVSTTATGVTGELEESEAIVLYGRRGARDETTELEFRGKAVPEDGCLGKAIMDLRKGYEYPEGAETASRIATESHRESQMEPRVKSALARWSACMTRSGYTYASPLDPLGQFLEGPVTTAELATAKADVSCKQRTGLLETWFGAESEIQRRMIGEESAVLEGLRDRHVRRVAAARSIIAKG